MDIDEQLEDAFDAAFNEDDGGVAEEETPADGAAPSPQQAQQHLEEEEYEDAEAPARGDTGPAAAEAEQQPGGSRQAARRPTGRTAEQNAVLAANPDIARAEDPAAAYKKQVFDSLTEDQKNRFEAFMRSSLAKPKMKRVMQLILRGAIPNERAVIAMCGIAKLFVGELVETARVCASQEGHTGPLLPRHVHRAYQTLSALGKLPHRARGRRLLCR